MDKEQVKDIAKDCGLVVGQHWNRSNMTTAFMLDFANAAIESYKAELLKEVGEPAFGYKMTLEELSRTDGRTPVLWFGQLPHGSKLYTSGQVAAAVLKATKPLEEKLAKAEQLVAEACGELAYAELDDPFLSGHGYANRVSEAIRSGWRKFLKGEV